MTLKSPGGVRLRRWVRTVVYRLGMGDCKAAKRQRAERRRKRKHVRRQRNR